MDKSTIPIWLAKGRQFVKTHPRVALITAIIAATAIGYAVQRGFAAFVPLVIEGVAHSVAARSIEGALEATVEETGKTIAKEEI